MQEECAESWLLLRPPPTGSTLPPTRTKSHRFLRWLLGLVVVLIGIGIQSVAAGLLSPSPVSCSPPACSVPPPRAAISPAIHHYTSSTYGYSLDYSTANITRPRSLPRPSPGMPNWVTDPRSHGRFTAFDPAGVTPSNSCRISRGRTTRGRRASPTLFRRQISDIRPGMATCTISPSLPETARRYTSGFS